MGKPRKHKRRGPKSTRSGCLMCKPHKHQGNDIPTYQEARARVNEQQALDDEAERDWRARPGSRAAEVIPLVREDSLLDEAESTRLTVPPLEDGEFRGDVIPFIPRPYGRRRRCSHRGSGAR